jgi:uncharacterized protein (TIGR03067 family)
VRTMITPGNAGCREFSCLDSPVQRAGVYTPSNTKMKTLRNALLIGMAAVAISRAWAEESPAIKADMAKLQGEWSMVSGSADGYAVPDAMLGNSKRVCQGDETTVTIGGQLLMKAKITIDPTKKPKTIDYLMTDGQTKGKKQSGIYELDGDTVRFCFAAPGADRPLDFTGKSGEMRTLSVWKREKAATPQPKQK